MIRRIPQAFIQDLLNQINLIDLIEKRVALKKIGSRFVAKCPFHQEKTASFYVDPQKQFYYCFGCNAHGNAIGFTMAFDRVEFQEAVRWLATEYGLELPIAEGSNAPSLRESYPELYTALEKANVFYQECLLKSHSAMEYLKKRGINEKTQLFFNLGFSPNQWNTLVQKTSNKPATIQLLATAGMLCEKAKVPGQYFDRFRNRIMFPIRNKQGQIIGFGGRAIDDQIPKYLNSPETILYHKSQELYGLHLIKKASKILIVEGYMDVIALYQHGFPFSVAPLGTAITKKQIQSVLYYTSEIIFCFDADTAGAKASWRALEILLPLMKDSTHASFLMLPAGEDPDSFLRKKGAKAFEEALKNALPLENFFFNSLKQHAELNSIHGRAQFAISAQSYLNRLPNGLFKQLMLEQLAKLIQVSTDIVIEQSYSNKITATPSTHSESNIPNILKNHTLQSKTTKQGPSAMRIAIILLLQFPDLLNHVLQEKDFPDVDVLNHLPLPGMPLLQNLLKIVQHNQNLTTGALLAFFQEKPSEQKHLAKLASTTIFTPKEGIKEEFLGALKCLQQQGVQKTILHLQQRFHELSDEEKLMLQKLIAYKVKKSS